MGYSETWAVPGSMIDFFRDALSGHDKVQAFVARHPIYYVIERTGSLSAVEALLVDEYTLGLAALYRAQAQCPSMDCIVTGGNWNAYTREAKDHGTRNRIGVFNAGEFFGALNLREPFRYVKRNERGQPVYRYRDA